MILTTKFFEVTSGIPLISSVVKKIIALRRTREINKLSRHFTKYFSPEVAMAEEIQAEAFSIRHRVYCEELGYEETTSSGLERDDFDARSLHLLIRNVSSQKYAGTVRLVCSSNSSEILPIEKYCLHSFYPHSVKPEHFPRDQICEISRLAVPLDFRKRSTDKYDGASEGAVNTDNYSKTEMRCFPFICVGLCLEIVAVAERKDIQHFFVMLEPKLARSLAFLGFKFEKVGDIIEYHGKRAAYYINLEMVYKNLSPSCAIMLERIKKELHKQNF
jgi:N-acyl amino acid synthase of PEP-CTERM/exosortase system